jgi:uncharacterized protein YndB with AHSA1/START domain
MTTIAGWTHRHTCTLPASPARVFAALTMRQELCRWFAEDVAVDLRDGGAFAFWGRYTYGVPSAADARQRITRVEPDRLLAFRWQFDGVGSEVTVTLGRGDGDRGDREARLMLEHRFDEKRDDSHFGDVVDDLWRLTIGNLGAHLRGGEGIVLPDYSDPSPEIRLSIVIDAPPERVFKALLDPAALNEWMAKAAEVEPRIGGRYSYGWTYRHGSREVNGGPTRILDLVPNERLVTDWPDWRGDPTKPPTRVAWLLEPVGEKTRVTVVHGDFPRTVDISDYPFGWSKFLTRLKELIEGSEP